MKNIKFKATLVIAALMFLTSLIIAHTEKASDVKETPAKDSVIHNVSVKEIVKKSNQIVGVRYIHQRVKPEIQEIELSSPGLNAELPLPELMQTVGFKINDESNVDYTNPELN